MDRRQFLGSVAVGTGLFAGLSGDPSGTDPDRAEAMSNEAGVSGTDGDTIYVSPDGDDTNDGTEGSSLGTIQEAIDRALPGETIQLTPGVHTYAADRRDDDGSGPPVGITVRDGTPENPITISGPEDAVVKRRPEEHATQPLFFIQHSHIHVRGVTLNGLSNPDGADDPRWYTTGLIEVKPNLDTDEYIQDVVLKPAAVGNSRYGFIHPMRTSGMEIGEFEVIGPAGVQTLLTDEEGHASEIVYLGTSPDSLGSDWHPWTEYDETSDIHVHHIDNSAGYHHSELVDTKLGTHDVTIEYCTDGGGSRNSHPDWPSASIRLQAFGATVRWCDLRDGAGNGVEIGSSKAEDALNNEENPSTIVRQAATENSVYGNHIEGFGEQALAFPVGSHTPEDQRWICDNEFDGTTEGTPGTRCPDGVPESEGMGHTGGETPWIVDRYTGDDGAMNSRGLLSAISDWANDRISTAELHRVIRAWAAG